MQGKTGFRAVFVRELKRVLSSKICIWGIFVAPLLSMLIMTWMMSSGLPTKIPIAVVDLDNSSTSRSLVRQLDAFPKTNIVFKGLSFNEARHQMEQMKVYAILTIPQDFARDATTGSQPKLVYYTNNAFMISGSLLFQDLKTVSTLAAASVGLKMGTAQGFTNVQIMPIVQPFKMEAHPISNPWLNYSVYLNNIILPGILFLMIIMFTVSSFGSEIKTTTGKYLVELGGNNITKVILGKVLPYTIIFMIISLFFMSMFYGYLHFPLKNGFLPMFFNYLCLVLSGQGLGIIIIAGLKNYRFGLSIASLWGVVTFSITGFSFSVLAMSGTLHAISNLFPLRHFFLVYLDQALNGHPIGYSMYSYGAMLAFVLVSFFFFPRLKNYLLEDEYEE